MPAQPAAILTTSAPLSMEANQKLTGPAMIAPVAKRPPSDHVSGFSTFIGNRLTACGSAAPQASAEAAGYVPSEALGLDHIAAPASRNNVTTRPMLLSMYTDRIIGPETRKEAAAGTFMGWSPSDTRVYEGSDRATGKVKWTATAADLVFSGHSQLRALAEVYACDDAKDKFVRDSWRPGTRS